jgi:hypothetical protein
MRLTRALPVLLLAILLATIFASSASAATSIGALRICQGCAQAGDLSRYQYVVLHSDQAALIPSLKAKNPAIKVLVYKNAPGAAAWAVSNGQDWATLPAGVGYVDADRNHPDWFLKDTSGARVEFSDYPGIWMMDFGSPSYQQAWVANVVADVQAHGWDGVMIDDVNVDQGVHLGGRTLARYGSAASQRAAMRDFIAAVGPALTSRGILAVPNIYTNGRGGPQLFSSWVRFASGAVLEHWTKWGSGTGDQFTGAEWSRHQEFLRRTQRAGKIFLAITYASTSDERSMQYARASFLLDWDGGRGALIVDTGPTDPWNEAWTADIGVPAGARFRDEGVWRRNYTNGTVVVNPSGGTRKVRLGRAYVAPDGSRVTSVTLAPATAAVLHRP